MTPQVTYDPEANAAYIRLSPEGVQESEEVSAGIVLDYDAQGRILGMEVLDARTHLPPDLLTEADRTRGAQPHPRLSPRPRAGAHP